MKLSAKQAIKEAQRLGAADAANHIGAAVERANTRLVHFKNRPAGFQMPVEEGVRYTFLRDGEGFTSQAVSDATVGAVDDGFSYRVGQLTPPLPEGTWIIGEVIFLGKRMVEVDYVGLPQIGD